MKRISILIVAVMLLTFTTTVAQGQTFADEYAAYNLILDEYMEEYGSPQGIYYTLFDIDHNGIDELIIGFGNCSDGYRLFGFDKGRIVEYDEGFSCVSFYEIDNCLYKLHITFEVTSSIDEYYIGLSKIILNGSDISYEVLYRNPGYKINRPGFGAWLNSDQNVDNPFIGLDDYFIAIIPELSEVLGGSKCIEMPEISDRSLLNPIRVILNGERIRFDQAPVIIKSRTMVPLRAVFEAMGYAVNWESTTKTAEAVKETDRIIVQIGNDKITYTKNGVNSTYLCDVAPQIVSSRTLVPVRAIAESSGYNVRWDGNTRTVYISK